MYSVIATYRMRNGATTSITIARVHELNDAENYVGIALKDGITVDHYLDVSAARVKAVTVHAENR